MKTSLFIIPLIFLSLSLSAAPREDDGWIQKCKKHKIFGISIGMTAGQVRSVFLKAPKTTLLPWSDTTPYSSYFRFDLDTGFGPLSNPLERFLDLGFAPIPTNATKRSEVRFTYDNPYGRSYPMIENHDPGNGTDEILPFIQYSAKFHDYIVYTNTIFLSK